MVSRRDYTAEAVAACKSVLVELVHMLGEIRDHLVIVGGWVPVLLVTGATEPHPGTLGRTPTSPSGSTGPSALPGAREWR